MDNSCKSEFKELNLAAKIILSSWYGLAGLAAIIGNAIVLWLVARNESLRTISNLFLASLAAADFVVGLVIDPVWIFTRCVGYDANSHVQTYGEVIDYLWIHTTVATTFNLCCVTMDRYLAILYPLRYQDILTKRRCYILIVTIWFISFILPCSRFFVKDGSVSLWLSFTIITVLIPMMIIIFCSVRILKAAAEQSKKIRNNYTVQSQEALRRGRRNSKAALTIGIVVGLFVACWLPSLITSLVNYFTPHHCGLTRQLLYYTVWLSVEALAFTSSGINPWVYCLRYDEFYKALTRTFPCVKRRNLEEALSHLRERKQSDM